jgi:uncharacterized protein YPO0396
MLSLTRIFLHNWHRFRHTLIQVDDSLYLAGHNGSGKSSVLDALQVALIADLTQIRFNSSAQERSERTLDTYVRSKIGESRFLRPGNTVAYIALEFADPRRDTAVTLGACIEAGEGKPAERTHFILSEALDPGLFFNAGRELTRRDLRKLLRGRRGAKVYDHVGEYRDELLNRLGGLNERFFDLFLKALRFDPIRDIRGFVEQWLLDKRPLEVKHLQSVKERLADLRRDAEDVEQRLAALDVILDHQSEARRLRRLCDQYALLAALLRAEEARYAVNAHQTDLARLQDQTVQHQTQLAEAQAAFKGAEHAWLEARDRLNRSESLQRKRQLEALIAETQRKADETRTRWHELRRALSNEVDGLRSLLSDSVLEPAEASAFLALLETTAGLMDSAAPPANLASALEAALPAAEAALERAQAAQVRLRDQAAALRQQGDDVQQRLANLRRDGQLHYPSNVEHLRRLLTARLGQAPALVCELLEVEDERWQNAVEAMLGARRFNLVVPPEDFERALHELDRARAEEKLYDVGLVDLERAQSGARPPQPGSLARHVRAQTEALQAYVNTVLGNIIACEAVSELRQHRRAVTPEVVAYQEYTVRAVPPRSYQPWFIGSRARRSQIELLERQLSEIGDYLAALAPQVQTVEAQVARLKRAGQLRILHERLHQPLDEGPLRAQLADYEAELRTLDLSGVEELEREERRLYSLKEQERQSVEATQKELTRLEERAGVLHGQLQDAQRALTERELQADETRTRFPDVAADAGRLLAERLAQPVLNLAESARNAEIRGKGFETEASKRMQQLTEAATAYNTQNAFAAIAHDPHEERYAQEQQRLAATELPRFKEQIAQAEREAEEELREHILHELREHIEGARRKLRQVNDALADLDFHGERYRFISAPASELQEYYDLITGSQLLGSGPLLESEFYRQHQAAFDRLYETLTRKPSSEADAAEQERLTDYRGYLDYDIEIKRNGEVSRLSRIMHQTSGGEAQTPFYLTIAASFVQLYRIGEHSARPTLRLVAFDEAFSKMDQDRIGSTLELFQRFSLQVITATPLERCEYLVPKMCTNLVLTAVGDKVLIEPYRNYKARLDSKQ